MLTCTNKIVIVHKDSRKVTDRQVCHFYFIFAVVIILTMNDTKVPAKAGSIF